MNQTSAAITASLADEFHVASAVPKPTAKGTPLRYSSAHACGRQMGYAGIGLTPTEPMDESGAWVTGLGTMIHERLQDAISRKFPSAQFEVASQIGDISGSCDALISVDDVGSHYGGTHVLYELKSMGTYNFDKQVGWNRMRGQFTDAKGPARKAIVQAGLNALGIEAENPSIKIQTLILGSVTFEALSKQKAANMGVNGFDRFLSEWEIPEEEWVPLAEEELARMGGFAYNLDNGYLPDRLACDDDGETLVLNPSGRNWQCEYCAFRTACSYDGPGQVRFLDSVVSDKGE